VEIELVARFYPMPVQALSSGVQSVEKFGNHTNMNRHVVCSIREA
jgi:hypothetical protein